MIDVSRSFTSPNGVRQAVDRLNLSVGAGEIVCILGPNGAGKTTTIKLAATLLEPTSGSIRVGGIDAVQSPRGARQVTGLVLGGDRGFYSRATAEENLKFFAELQGVSGRKRGERIATALEAVGLGERKRDRVETFSRGMKQRLHIARALIAEPALVLLDEPSIGLDPEGARELRHLVAGLRDEGRSIVLTTHYMHEAEELADRLIVIDEGSIVAEGSARDIAGRAGVTTVTSLRASVFHAELEAALLAVEGIAKVSSEARDGLWFVDVIWAGPPAVEQQLRQIVDSADGMDVVFSRDTTLEESYLAFLGQRRLREPELSAE